MAYDKSEVKTLQIEKKTVWRLEKERWPGSKETQVLVLAPKVNCQTLSKNLLNHPKPQSPHVQKQMIIY